MNEVILVGNPNVGKTTFLNALTRSNERVSNWHGVTVDVKSKLYNHNNIKTDITDLPGIYSLQGFSNEEKIARDYILKNQDKIFLNVCDSGALIRCLKLTTELINLGLKVLVVINVTNKKDEIDCNKLEEELGVKVVKINARKKNEIVLLKNKLNEVLIQEKTQKIFKTNKKPLIYHQIKEIFAKNAQKDKLNKELRIDKIVLNKLIFICLFLTMVFMVFYLTFGPVGLFISNIFKWFLNQIANKMRYIINCTNISLIIKTVISEVLIDGLVSVLSFLPQIVILMFCFGVIEECGLMSRVSFMLDGILKKVGLTGKSLFSLSMGFGCTTSAVMATRNLENSKLRKRTILLLPFVPCSAKLPIILTVVSLFFDNYKYIFVFIVFLIYLSLCLGVAFVYKKTIFSDENLLILEMPKYRFPSIKKLLKDIYIIVKDFIIKVLTLILFFNFLIWLLQNFSCEFEYLSGENFEASMLYKISSIFVPVFEVVGLGDVRIVVALFMGLVAKELLVSSLVLMGVGFEIFTPISAVVFLTFVLIYSPCISAILAIKNELGYKFAMVVFAVQFVLAFFISFLVDLILRRSYLLIWLGIVFVLDICVLVMLKLRKKKLCRGNCCACRKISCN